MKNIFILAMLMVLAGRANAQSLTATNSSSYCTVELTMYANDLPSNPACSIISNQIGLGVCCGASSMFSATDPCAFQSAIGWSSISTAICPPTPMAFVWTDATFNIKCPTPTCGGSGGSTSGNVGETLSACITTSESNSWSGSVGSCSFGVTWANDGYGNILVSFH